MHIQNMDNFTHCDAALVNTGMPKEDESQDVHCHNHHLTLIHWCGTYDQTHQIAGGLLFPYYIGIVIALRDELGILTDSTPVAGASAGSLIAATCKSGISESDLIQVHESWLFSMKSFGYEIVSLVLGRG